MLYPPQHSVDARHCVRICVEYMFAGGRIHKSDTKGDASPPKLHSIHHRLDVHRYNFNDIPLWDRMFGTDKDADAFAPQCGFPRDNERKLGRMLLFPGRLQRPVTSGRQEVLKALS
jgi:hypothetical protein